MSAPELRDIHMPGPQAWWPPAPGWWLLLGLIVLAAVVAIYTLRKMQHRARTRRRVLAELERAIGTDTSGALLAAALSRFLRRMALRDSPSAAALRDERWLAYLDERVGGDAFSRGIGRALLDAPFRAAADFDGAALIALVRRWTHTVLDAERRRA